MISFNITGRRLNCQAKNRLFFAAQAEKGEILGFNSGEILLPDLAKNGIRTFFSATIAGQGTIENSELRNEFVATTNNELRTMNILWKVENL
jgi:hypothetical protein